MNKYIKIIGGIVATIFLGAIGSGLWERMLSPFLNWISLTTASSISFISDKYLDSIYFNASNFVPFRTESLIIYLLLIILCGSVYLYSFSEQFRIPISHSFKGWPVILTSGSFLAMLFFGFVTDNQSFNVKNYSERNMEMIRPYITEKEYLLLKSEFLRIEGKESFVIYNKKLIGHFAESKINMYEVTLP